MSSLAAMDARGMVLGRGWGDGSVSFFCITLGYGGRWADSPVRRCMAETVECVLHDGSDACREL